MPSFFVPIPEGFDSSRDPTAGNLPFKAKKMLKPGDHPGDQPGVGGGGGWVGLGTAGKTDALTDSHLGFE